MSKNRRVRWRNLWLRIHRWLGLVAGLLFVLMGLSGSFLVFHHAIDAWLNPDLLISEVADVSHSLDEIMAVAKEQGETEEHVLKFADAPREASGVWTVWFQQPIQDAPFRQVYVDPYSAQVTGKRVRGEYLTTFIYLLHMKLLAGRAGANIVGISGILLLISFVSGIYLWWPMWRHSWRAAFAIRGGSRFVFDSHKVLGLGSLPLLLVIAFSGVYMVFPSWFEAVPRLLADEKRPSSPLISQVTPGAKTISVDRAVEIAQEILPAAELNRIHFPTNEKGVYSIRLRQPGDVRQHMGNSRVWLDRYSGQVLAVRDWNEHSAVDTFFAWQFPLHNGEALGLGGRWFVFLSGVVLAILYFTGFWLWFRKKRAHWKQKQKQRVLRGKQTVVSDFIPPSPSQISR
ncbi:PepSY domain-containing protein [Bremerella cremea]|uniref:PepSY domain-containing protein n=1 Tax=Bremerella cremea TaxID=1031537 RepID=A0A368KKM4_9BACT|nr:PepSY-associated TM helix domain-containing protein [Bremerella cremea]RCS41321.1 PepSY domain-containing protein [Bremerella cremea]